MLTKGLSSDADQLQSQLQHLQAFLAWLIPIAIGFALLEASVFLFVPSLPVGIAVAITGSYLCCLLAAQWQIRRGQLYAAVIIVCSGLLAVEPLILLVWPAVLPALGVVPLLVVTIALPYLDAPSLRRLMITSGIVTTFVVIAYEFIPPIAQTPAWVTSLLRISTLVAVVILALFLLGQFRSRLADTLLKMQSAQQRLEIQNEELRVTLHSIGDGVITADPNGIIVTINPAAEELVGWREQEVIGRPFTDICFLVDEVTNSRVNSGITAVLSGDVPLSYIRNAFLPARDGTVRNVAGTVASLRSQTGHILGIVVALQDVSEQKRAASERLKWERQLLETQKLESLGVLAGGIAHDFNNLLMGILGNASLALVELEPDSPAQYSLEQIEQIARRAAELIGQMLAYSGKGHFRIQPLNLNDLILETTTLLNASITKNATLQCNLAADLPLIEADSSQMHQVVMNLVINASEAIGEQQGIITITTRRHHLDEPLTMQPHFTTELPPGDYVVLEVSDTGCGMDSETLGKIFEPFFTTKFTGRGLGLAAVLGIVRGHHGMLTVNSTPRQGTTFTVLLPSLAVLDEPPVVQMAQPIDERASGKILVVDDDADIRVLLTRMLERQGWVVIAATDGQEAVHIYEQQYNDINCIFLDLTMPRMNGAQAFELMHAINPHLCVVVMSGYNEQFATQRFAGMNLAGFLQKPFTATTLTETLSRVLHKNQ